jgi:hypothetical protein
MRHPAKPRGSRVAVRLVIALSTLLFVTSADAQTEQPPSDQPTSDQSTTNKAPTDKTTTDKPTTDKPTTDKPTHSDKRSNGDHAGRHGGLGLGIGIGLGTLFSGPDKSGPVLQDSNTGANTGANKDTPPTPLADTRPTPPKDDPKDGIPVPGGKVHRGTGDYVDPKNAKDKRAGFYLWIDFDANGSCKACAWYQFAKVTTTVEGHDVTKDLAVGGGIKNKIGGVTHFGKWDGDWHKNDEAKEKKKKPHIKMPGENPPVEAGPYEPRPIPGANGTEGLVDAPNWGNTGGWEQLIDRLGSRGIIKKQATGGQPPDSNFTMVITTLFRDYLYCIDPTPPQCLGSSEETYVETIKFKLTWVASSDVDLGTSANQTWNASVTVVSDDSSVTFGAWKGCK